MSDFNCNQVCPLNTLGGCKKDELNDGVCLIAREEIIDLHARSCPATYAELLAKYSAVCKERDELADAYHKMWDIATETAEQRDYFMRRLMEVENNV